jgi:hypothetical protein
MRARVIAALLFASLLVAGLAPSALAASSNKKAMWGPVTDFPIYHALGVGIYEMDLNWLAAAPTRPGDPRNPNDSAYHWDATIDYAIGQAAHYHMRVMLEVSQTPSWANGGHTATYPPSHPSDLADFLTAAARRYRSVHMWMIWGEPNRKARFATIVPASPNATRLTPAQAAAPQLYARMVDASYGALKRLSSSSLIIAGDTNTTGDIYTGMWIKYMRLPNGRPPRMDLYGHNPFTWRGAPNLANSPSPDNEVDFSDLRRLEQLVDRNLAPPHHHIDLFLSEFTIPTAPWDDVFDFYATPAVQAQWITDACRIVRRSPWIYSLGWSPSPYDGVVGTTAEGLIYHDGTRKPGYYSFKTC